MVNFDSNILLGDLLLEYPEVKMVFSVNGLNEFDDEEYVSKIGPFLRLETILKMKHINPDIFYKELEEKIIETNFGDKGISVSNDRLNMLSLLPCPLKLPIQAEFESCFSDLSLDGKDFNYLIDGNANNQISFFPYVDYFNSIDDIPDIVISSGVNSFYYRHFINNFIDKGYFVDTADYLPNQQLRDVGIKDPGGNYTVISMNILVMVIDNGKIGDRSIPEKWGDLLEPEFEKEVAIRGKNNLFCETTLLTIFKQHGIDGIQKLGRAVKYGWHPSQMAKAAGNGRLEAPTISIMPYFFTRTIKNKENVTVVWPKDGAIISPVTMLVKKTKAKSLKPVIDFFNGDVVGNICANANFPSINPKVNNKIAPDTQFNWLGWDFIKQNDIGNLVDYLNSEFLKSFEQGE